MIIRRFSDCPNIDWGCHPEDCETCGKGRDKEEQEQEVLVPIENRWEILI